jgi:hypothetical protein
MKTGLLEQNDELCSIKTEMKNAGIVAAKCTVLAVEISKTQRTFLDDVSKPLAEKSGRIRHMMKRHATHDKVIRPLSNIAILKINEPRLHVGQAHGPDLAPQNIEHTFGAILARDRLTNG